MKGKAESQPRNHVKWANGFESNMPDWPTARACAVTERMTYLLRQARTILLQFDKVNHGGEVDETHFRHVLGSIQELCDWTDLGIHIGIDPAIPGSDKTVKTPMPPPPGFPKPPGVL